MKNKPKLSFPELLEKIHNRGITFNNHSQEQAIDILKNRNYYYRLISYRKNFNKTKGKYLGLDFAALVDLASIDTYLREYLLKLCLDIEHTSKTLLMTHITENDNEDGYKIVKEFASQYESFYQKSILHFEKNKYKQDMFKKRKRISIWVFLEIIDFGTLNIFLNFYAKKYPEFKLNFNPDLLKFVKNIRNACAHNDVFFVNVFNATHKTKRPSPNVVSFANLMGIERNDVRYIKIADIIALHYIHSEICSRDLNARRNSDGRELIERVLRNSHYYNQCYQYHRFFNLIYKCVDFLTH